MSAVHAWKLWLRQHYRGLVTLVLAMLAALFAWPVVRSHVQATGVLWNLFTTDPLPSPVAWFSHGVLEREDRWQLRDRRVRTRHYMPKGTRDPQGMVLVHGVHHDGIDEVRLRAFAKSLSAAGFVVVTPEIPELAQYRVEATTIDTIAQSAARLAQDLERQQVCVVGISFAGGLSLLAAAGQQEQQPIGCVVALGAHHDLKRLAHYYAGRSVLGPAGETYPGNPHPYGLLVILHAHMDKFFETADVDPARRVLALHMQGHRSASAEKLRALSPEVRDRLARMLTRPQESLAAELLTAVNAHQDELTAVSPRRRLQGLQVPTFLVHGTEDPVVPSLETRWLATEVPARVLEHVLITPLLRHAEPDGKPAAREVLALVRFVAGILDAARRPPAVPRTSHRLTTHPPGP